MYEICHELDRESIEALKAMLGQRISVLMTMNANANPSKGQASCFSPAFFEIGDGFVKLTNDWYVSPGQHDFHISTFRRVAKLNNTFYNSADSSRGNHSQITLSEYSAHVEAIEILSLRCQDAVKKDGVYYPDEEVLVYDWGINLRFSDDTSASISTEHDSIIGELIVFPYAIEPYHKENTWVEHLEVRQKLTP